MDACIQFSSSDFRQSQNQALHIITGAMKSTPIKSTEDITNIPPLSLHCSNYKAEEEAHTHAANSIKNEIDNTTQVVFLTDALSVLQALKNDKLPQPQQASYNIKSLTTVLQWIHAHCGVWGNEQADKLAKYGAEQQQEENPVCYTEMKTIIKSLFNTPQQQTTIFRLTSTT
ncbi:unnamed protein product [Mytilus edulis]|uniref:RNase H type-1 domain-containing protein n=1 Tax=Mytilus edulis TaxID=6550 RepID=A0A8S3TDE9_MYTED|nr:unnamed protein product [Mytilus edulis]